MSNICICNIYIKNIIKFNIKFIKINESDEINQLDRAHLYSLRTCSNVTVLRELSQNYTKNAPTMKCVTYNLVRKKRNLLFPSLAT